MAVPTQILTPSSLERIRAILDRGDQIWAKTGFLNFLMFEKTETADGEPGLSFFVEE